MSLPRRSLTVLTVLALVLSACGKKADTPDAAGDAPAAASTPVTFGPTAKYGSLIFRGRPRKS